MDPLTSMITTAKIMRQNSRELYNVIHQTCVGILRMEIFSLTMFNQLDYMQKDRACVKLFCKSMTKPTNAYHLHIYVNDSTSYENPVTYH